MNDRPRGRSSPTIASPIRPTSSKASRPTGCAPLRCSTAGGAPDPATASVLEIGCGDGHQPHRLRCGLAARPGGRLRPFGDGDRARPRASPRHAGSTNVDLHVGDVLTYPRDGEKFDYIICHGVLSWVPEPVRRRDRRAHRRAARARRPRLPQLRQPARRSGQGRDRAVPPRAWVGDITDPVEAMKRGRRGHRAAQRNAAEELAAAGQLDVLIEEMPTVRPGLLLPRLARRALRPGRLAASSSTLRGSRRPRGSPARRATTTSTSTTSTTRRRASSRALGDDSGAAARGARHAARRPHLPPRPHRPDRRAAARGARRHHRAELRLRRHAAKRWTPRRARRSSTRRRQCHASPPIARDDRGARLPP